MFILLCIGVFMLSFTGSVVFKLTHKPAYTKQYSVDWNDSVGIVHANLPYGDGEAKKFYLYVPAVETRDSYKLVVYLHAGGFSGSDKAGDRQMLEWLCSKGYVAAGINYTLFGEAHPEASVYTQSMEIKESIPAVVAAAAKLGYKLDGMAISGGSAGGTLALLYAYRDAADSVIPVKMLFEAVGPSSFYPEDWTSYGLDQNPEAAASLFSVMAGTPITTDILGTPAFDEAMRPISAFMWVNQNSVPTVCAYGAYDRVCPFASSKHLIQALEENDVPHEYFEFPHSGHGLQNDDAVYEKYMAAVEAFLDRYLPV